MPIHSVESLRQALAGLRARTEPRERSALRASPLEDGVAWLFADADGRPGLLVRELSGIASERVSMRYAYVTVTRDIRCGIDTGDNTEQVLAALVECESSDLDVQDYFMCLLVVVLQAVAEDPTPAGLEAAIRGLRELLASSGVHNPPIVGLWAELLTIVASADPARLAHGWHVDGLDPFDFLEGSNAVEVKATEGISRQHRFRGHQLSHPPRTLVLSYLLTPNDSGPCVLDLLEEAVALVGPERSKVERLVLASTHDQIYDARRIRFSRELALAARAGFDAADVPAIRLPYPVGVSHVEFDVDLSVQVECRSNSSLPALWRAAWPEHFMG